MTALLAYAVQMRALYATLLKLDPPMADALAAQIASTVEADAVLRECGIQLASLHTLQVANGHSGDFALRLRARVDALIAPLTHPMPVAQIDGD